MSLTEASENSAENGAGTPPSQEEGASADAGTGTGGTTLVGQQVGKYKVLRALGKGGMGAVYEAVHESIGQRIAIKVLNEEYSSDSRHVQRFFDEARAVNIVQHPGLVKVYDFGHLPGGTAYITMEFLAGESLQDRLNRLKKENKRMDLAEALRIARQIGSALEAVHAKGIAHRDLKPANLFIVPDNEAPGGERIKVLDFGIAKFYGKGEKGGGDASGEEQRHLTTVGKLLGTPVYMSPEQCSGAEQVDDRIDVYALGVILYQLLSGKLPFDAPVAVLIMTKHITEPPPPLGDAEPNLPPALCDLVHEMLAKNPQERPSMAQVVVRLERILEVETGLSTSEWRSVHRTRLRRTRRWPMAVAGIALVLLSGALIGIGKYRRAQRERAAAAALAEKQAAAQRAAAAEHKDTAPEKTAVPPAPAPAAPAPAAVAKAPENPQTPTGRTRKKSRAQAQDKTAGDKNKPAAPPAGGGGDIPIFR